MPKFLTLPEYLHIARKILRKYNGLHKNDEAVSCIAYHMMKADEKFTDDVGYNREGLRMVYAKYGIRHYFRQVNKEKKIASIQIPIVEDMTIEQNIKANIIPIEDYIFYKEVMQLAQNTLPAKQYQFFKGYFENQRISDMVKEFGISRQGIHNSIKKSIRRIQNELQVSSETTNNTTSL